MRKTFIARQVETTASDVEAAIGIARADAFAELVNLTTVAIDTLAYVAAHGRHEEARVSAAKEILDRAELTPEVRISVTTGQQDERSTRLDELRKQLGGMRGNLSQVLDLPSEEETA